VTDWIVGIDNPSSRDPSKALEPHSPVSAGGRLFKMSGMSMDDYFDSFRRVNVIDRPFPFSRGDRVVVLGLRPWNRLRLPPALGWWTSVERGGVTFHIVPHPSGRSLLYNDEGNRKRLRDLLQMLARTGHVQGRRQSFQDG
jgi:hypothetical protein